uniref:Peptidyl-prolyl cis-trans isomerase n=1 Tax=Trypanosoma congolense (strain IL3000) TaxID=1068625 RepID=G0USC2_TRYCI|nr:putative cyclophilin-type peptidyl-prolyl cis-trans isomerase [Trypanosoma congolense IL3000]
MSLSSTTISCLGCTTTHGSTASGTQYVSHRHRLQRTSCWMELACFEEFPETPSLAGSLVQQGHDLLESVKPARHPIASVRIEFELFDDESPKACANFRNLCAGKSASGGVQSYWFKGVPTCYLGTYFHKIVPNFFVQGGDLTMQVDGGANHLSSFGRGWFVDEYKRRRMNEVGLLAMANNGPNSNGSQFFITTSEVNEKAFNGRHVCFGRIVRGLDEFMREVAPFGDSSGQPSRFIVVTNCSVGTLQDSPPQSAVGVTATNGTSDEKGTGDSCTVPP